MRSQKEAGAALVNRLRGEAFWNCFELFFIIILLYDHFYVHGSRGRKKEENKSYSFLNCHCELWGWRSKISALPFPSVVSQLYKEMVMLYVLPATILYKKLFGNRSLSCISQKPLEKLRFETIRQEGWIFWGARATVYMVPKHTVHIFKIGWLF